MAFDRCEIKGLVTYLLTRHTGGAYKVEHTYMPYVGRAIGQFEND